MRKHFIFSGRGAVLVRGIITLVLLCAAVGCEDKDGQNRPIPGSSESSPRYMYAHIYLRKLFFADPYQFINTLEAEGKEYLGDVWVVQAKGDPADLDDIDYLTIPEKGLYIIMPPRPMMMPEPFFIGVTVKDGRPRYVTLEKSLSLNEKENGLLCGWTAAGEHENYGLMTSELTMENFIKGVEKVLARGD
jgi:hypothetical protein